MSEAPCSTPSTPASAEVPAVATEWPASQWLDEAQGHRVWWCESATGSGPDADPCQALPVLIVHGGPGGASRIEPTRWFDGLPVRWIAMDQRGCGRSTPRGATAGNDLPALLHDMERLRQRLGLERWAIAGGSWGARVALAYAAAHPRRVQGLFIRSPFFGSLAETQRYIEPWRDWLGEAGQRWLGPTGTQRVEALYRGATELLSDGAFPSLGSPHDEARLAQAWSAFDDAQSAPGGVRATGAAFDAQRLPAAADALVVWRVHAHYGLRRWGGADGVPQGVPLGLTFGAQAARCPVRVVWGAADATCDPALARQLSAGLSGAVAHEVADAGHRMGDPRLAPALREAARAWVADLLA